MRSKLLKRQLRRALGVADEAGLDALLARLRETPDASPGAADLSSRFVAFLGLVDEAYVQSDRDLELRTRSLEISSQELLEANERLRQESLAQENALRTLRATAENLVSGQVTGERLDEAEGAGIERLSSLMGRLVDERRLVEERLELALRGSGSVLWDWDLASNRLLVGDAADTFIGQELGRLGDFTAAFLRLSHPDDFGEIRRRLIEHMKGIAHDLTADFRLRGGDGGWHWVIVRGMAVSRDAAGRVLRMAGTLRDITERKAQELDLLRAKNAAEAASRAKGDFLASVSHEIRTPMNGVIGLSELLLESDLADDQRRYLEIIRDSAGSLLAIINDILDFSKIESGTLAFEPVEFSIRGLLADALGGLALRADQKGLELAYDVPDSLHDAYFGDPGRLRQVLVNLVGNAIKFTDAGEVEVGVEPWKPSTGGTGLAFSVRDTGIGIAPELHDYVFEAFTQADASVTRRAGGTGLGLAICLRIVTLMDGRIWVESVAGGGSTFRFTVALEARPGLGATRAPAAWLAGLRALVVDDSALSRRLVGRALREAGMEVIEAADRIGALRTIASRLDIAIVDSRLGTDDGIALAANLRHLRGDLPILALLHASQLSQGARRARECGFAATVPKPASGARVRAAVATVLAPAPEPACEPAGQNRPASAAVTALRVLLAEDNPINALVATRVLSGQGHRVTLAQSGRQAVDLWDREPFDIILMDMQMPEMDGVEAAREIREREACRGGRTPIVAVTANAMAEDREKCLAAGMDGYLSKPFTLADLRAVLARVAVAPA